VSHTAQPFAAHGPFGLQALACPDQCSLKAELRTGARCIFMRFGCALAHVRLWLKIGSSTAAQRPS